MDHCCLGFTKPDKLNLWPVMGADNTQLAITPSILADSGETLRKLAILGTGVACLSAFTVSEDVETGRLVPLLKDKTLDIPIPVYLVYYSDRVANRRMRCLIDYIAAHISLRG